MLHDAGTSEGRQERLLEVVLWVLVAIAGSMAAITAAGITLPWNTRAVWASSAVGVVYALGLVALRTGHRLLAAHLLVVGVVLGTWLSTLVPGGITGGRSHAFVALNILVASFALHARAGAVVGALDAAGLVALWAWRPAYTTAQLTEDVLILGVFALIVLTVARFNELDRTSLKDAKRRLQDSLAMQEALVQTSADAVIAVGEDGRVLAFNRVAQRWVDQNDLPPLRAGGRFMDSVPDDLRAQVASLIAEASSGGPVRSEFAWNSERGPSWVQTFLHELPGGSVTVQVRDVTKERRLQIQERKTYRDRVELEKLREMDQFRMRLLNTASHELRTPITPLRLQLSLLERRLSPEVDLQTHHSLDVMRRNVERLALLADDLLDVARLEAGKMPIEPHRFDLDEFVQRELRGYEAIAMQTGVELDIHAGSGACVDADPARLAQVLTNLTNNAIKFSAAGGHVTVETRLVDDEAVVEVRDDGAGFSPHKAGALFRPFSQLHETPRRQGSGLGLYICKGIMEGHGGRIWGSSQGPGQGATFAIALPAAPRTTLKGRAQQVPVHD